MERDFKGVWIPKEIWLDERLNALEKIIFVEIDSLCSDERGCFASNQYLAEFCQCSETKISKAISKLIDLGYLYVVSFNGRQRELQSCLAKNARLPSKKCKAAKQKMQDNNIDNNKDNNSKVSKKEKSPERNNELTAEQKTETYDDIIETYTDNRELQQTLKEYIKMRQMKKAPLTNEGLKLILQELKTFSPSTLYQIGVLQKAIMNGSNYLYELTEQEATRTWERHKKEVDKFFD